MNDKDWGALIGLGIVLLGAAGWICNIVEIAHTDSVSGMTILRAIGIFFFPLGAVLGYV